jgi:hypothetical protein
MNRTNHKKNRKQAHHLDSGFAECTSHFGDYSAKLEFTETSEIADMIGDIVLDGNRRPFFVDCEEGGMSS